MSLSSEDKSLGLDMMAAAARATGTVRGKSYEEFKKEVDDMIRFHEQVSRKIESQQEQPEESPLAKTNRISKELREFVFGGEEHLERVKLTKDEISMLIEAISGPLVPQKDKAVFSIQQAFEMMTPSELEVIPELVSSTISKIKREREELVIKRLTSVLLPFSEPILRAVLERIHPSPKSICELLKKVKTPVYSDFVFEPGSWWRFRSRRTGVEMQIKILYRDQMGVELSVNQKIFTPEIFLGVLYQENGRTYGFVFNPMTVMIAPIQFSYECFLGALKCLSGLTQLKRRAGIWEDLDNKLMRVVGSDLLEAVTVQPEGSAAKKNFRIEIQELMVGWEKDA